MFENLRTKSILVLYILCIFAAQKIIIHNMDTRAKELMQERGLTSMTLAARMDEKPNVVNTALCRGISSLAVIERFARGLRVPVWEMLHRTEVSAVGHELDEWSKPCDKLRLETLMHEQGMTQAQLAEKMGANRPNVNKWMHSTKLTLATIEQFAKAFGIVNKLYLMFISQEEYDTEMARRMMDDPAFAADMERVKRAEKRNARFGLLQPVRPMVEAETEEPVFAPDTNDLFAQYPDGMTPEEMYQMELMQIEEEERREKEGAKPVVQMQEGVTYVCGNTRITIVNGVMEIRVQDKKAI